MSKLANRSSDEAIRNLKKLGWTVTSAGGKGSHTTMVFLVAGVKKRTVTVPNTKEIKKGMMKKILVSTGLSIEQLFGKKLNRERMLRILEKGESG